jgi:hypothetical protein
MALGHGNLLSLASTHLTPSLIPKTVFARGNSVSYLGAETWKRAVSSICMQSRERAEKEGHLDAMLVSFWDLLRVGGPRNESRALKCAGTVVGEPCVTTAGHAEALH